MKAYIITTGAVFGLITLAHVWRVAVEGTHVVNPFFILITIATFALGIWAWRLLITSPRS